ncbi:MAG: dimethyl sulfoxide reductase anchor subunit family protein [Planctomycetota bacterium]
MTRPGRESPEWSLIFFTVLAQAAAGVCVARALFGLFARACAKYGEFETLTDPLLDGVLGLLAVAGLAAVFHLGRKGAARFALANLRTSWLSREILLALLLALVVAARRVTGVPLLDWVAALAGVLLTYGISRLYMIRTVPAWNAWTTPAAFFGTMLLLGCAITGTVPDHVAKWLGYRSALANDGGAWLGLATAMTALFLAVVARLHFSRFPPRAGTGGLSKRELMLVLVVRIVSLAVGGLMLAFLKTYGLLWRDTILAGSANACFLLLVSELIGRFTFYASHRRVGL